MGSCGRVAAAGGGESLAVVASPEPLPVAGDGEPPLSAARRAFTGRTEG